MERGLRIRRRLVGWEVGVRKFKIRGLLVVVQVGEASRTRGGATGRGHSRLRELSLQSQQLLCIPPRPRPFGAVR